MDIAQINAALAGLKHATEIVKSLRILKAFADHQALLIELQGSIIDAQSAALAHQQSVSALIAERDQIKKELAHLKTDASEWARYKLLEVGPQTYVYAFTPAVGSTEPAHWLCARCYSNKKKSILEHYGDSGGKVIYRCYAKACGKQIDAENPKVPGAPA